MKSFRAGLLGIVALSFASFALVLLGFPPAGRTRLVSSVDRGSGPALGDSLTENLLRRAAPDRGPEPSAAVRMTFGTRGINLAVGSESLSVRLEGIRIGEHELVSEERLRHVAPALPPDGAVEFERGPVLEKYLPLKEGVEQVFVLDSGLESLRRGGDLVVDVALESTLRPRLAAGRNRVDFIDGRGSPALTYGAATAIDHEGRREQLSYRLTGSRLEMVLDRRFLAEARFPLTVDPIIGTNVSIDLVTGYLQRPDIAAGPDSYLILAEQNIAAEDGNILCKAINLYGSRSALVALDVAAGEESRRPRVAASNSNVFLAVWQERTGTGTWSIQGRLVTVTNNVPAAASAEFPISAGSNNDLNPDVGFSTVSGTFLVVFERELTATNHDIFAVAVTTTGAVGTPFAVDSSGTFEEKPSVPGSFGNPTGVAWIRRSAPGASGDVYVASVNMNSLSVGTATPASLNSVDEDDPDLGGTGSTAFVVWARTAPAGDHDIVSRKVTFGGGGASNLGVEFVVDGTAADTVRPRCDTGSTSPPSPERHVIFTYSWNPDAPPSDGFWDILGAVHDWSADPPGLVESLTLETQAGNNDYSAVAVNASAMLAVGVWEGPTLGGEIIMGRATLTSNPVIALDPPIFQFAGTLGMFNPPGQGLLIANAGNGTLNYTISTDQPWLNVDAPVTGSVPFDGFDARGISVDISGLAPGIYMGNVIVTDGGSLNSPQIVPVMVQVVSVSWVIPPAASYSGGQTISFSWSFSTGTPPIAATHNQVHYEFGMTPDQPGLPGTYSGSVEAPFYGGSISFQFTPHVIVNGVNHLGSTQMVQITPATQPYVGVTPNTLNFVAAQGGPNPNSQSVSISNPGSGTLNWTASSNVPWLKLSPSSGTNFSNAPATLVTWVDAAGLTAGTHSGTITVSDPGALGSPKTVSVTLEVVSVTWVTSPAGSYVGGTSIPVSWNVQAGPLATSHTNVHHNSGDPPYDSSIYTPVQAGSPGIYSDTLLTPVVTQPTAYFVAAHAVVGNVDARSPIAAIELTPGPKLDLGSTALEFGTTPGVNPASQGVTIRNVGGGILNWTATASAPWVSVTPSSGARPAGTMETISISANVAALGPGAHLATVTVADPSAAGSPKTLAVVLTIGSVSWTIPPAASCLSGDPIPVSWALSAGGWNAIHNRVHYALTNPPTGGSWTADQPGPSGGYSDTVTAPFVSAPTLYYFRAEATVGSAVFVSPVVSVTVSPATTPRIAASPSGLSFLAESAGPNPPAQMVTVTNGAGGTLNWTASTNASWLSVGPASGSLSAGVSTPLTVVADLLGLAPGSHAATITLADPSASNSPVTVPVTLTVVSISWVVPPPSSIAWGETLAVSWNLAIGSLNATSNRVHSYVGNPIEEYQSLYTPNLPGGSGTYAAQIDLVGYATSAPRTFRVEAVIEGRLFLSPEVDTSFFTSSTPTIYVSPSTLTFNTLQGAAPISQNIWIANTGLSTLNWTATGSAPWLSVSPPSGTIASNSPMISVGATVNAAGLAPGTHQATISIEDPSAANSPRTVAVTLNVSARPVNDDFAAATPLTGSGATVTGTNVNATAEAGEPGLPSGGGLTSVWWTWSAPASGVAVINTFGSSLNTTMGVYTGATLGGLSLVGSSDNASGTMQSQVGFVASAGTTYRIQVSGVFGQTGSIVLQISQGPRIGPSPPAVSIVAALGAGAPPGFPLTIRNVGTDTLNWSASEAAPWLSMSTSSGSLIAGQADMITLTADPSGLAVGTYSGTITVTDPGATNTPMTIPVTLEVVSITWAVSPDAGYVSGQTIALSWTLTSGSTLASHQDAHLSPAATPWLGVSSGNQPGSSGTYSASFVAPEVTAPTAYSIGAHATLGSIVVETPVQSVVILPRGPTVQASTSSLTFAASATGPASASQSVILRNAAPFGTLNWSAVGSDSWILAAPLSGSLEPGASQSVDVAVDGTGLAPGTYLGRIVFNAPGSSNESFTVDITLHLVSLSWLSPPAGVFAGGEIIAFQWSLRTGSVAASHHGIHYGTTNPPAGQGSAAEQPGLSGNYASSIPAPIVAAPSVLYIQPHAVVLGAVIDGPIASVQVNPPAGPLIGLSATTLGFAAVQAGANPPSQIVDVGNAGSGTLTWSAASSAAWLSASPAGGAVGAGLSQALTVSVDTAGLSAGVHSAVVLVTAAGAANSPQVVTVNLTLGAAPPTIMLSPNALAFTTAQYGGNPYDQKFKVSNTSLGTLQCTMVEDGAWLTISSSSVTISPGQSFEFTAGVNNLGLAQGSYSASITVAAPGATNTPQILPVTLNVGPSAPLLGVNPTSLQFTVTEGASAPLTQSLYIGNRGRDTLNWGLWETASWLEASPSTGLVNFDGYDSVTITVRPTGMAVGTYSTTVTVSSPQASNGPISVPVALNVVSSTPIIQLDPSVLSFSAVVGGPNPIQQRVQVVNKGPGELSWTATGGAGWLVVNPGVGTGVPNSFQWLFVGVDVTGLVAGNYSGLVSVQDPSAPNSPQTVTINLTVYPGGPLAFLEPASLAFGAGEGGPNSDSQTLTLVNRGSAALNWAASGSAGWLKAAPASGSLPPGGSHRIDVEVDALGLAPGTYWATLTLNDPACANGPQHATVKLTVASLDWVTTPPPTVAAGTTIPMTWSLSVGSGTASITYVQMSTTVPWGSTGVEYQPAPSGSYSGVIKAPVVSAPTVYYFTPLAQVEQKLVKGPSIPVTITPTPASGLYIGVVYLEFYGAQGGANPSAKIIQVQNQGTSRLDWTASANASWVTLAPSSGILAAGESQYLFIDVDHTGLTAGDYTAIVTVSDPAAPAFARTFEVRLTVISVAWLIPPGPSYTFGQTIPVSWSVSAGSKNPVGTSVAISGNYTFSSSDSVSYVGNSGTYSGTLPTPMPVNGPTTVFLRPSASKGGAIAYGPVVSTVINPGPTPFTVYPTTLTFAAIEGGPTPPSKTLNLNGNSWTATTPQSWINLSPANGNFAVTQTSVSVNPAGLTSGEHEGTIVFDGTLSVPVKLHISTGNRPPNDDFAARLALVGAGVTTTGTNVGSTSESGEPNPSYDNRVDSVWWTWTAPGTGPVSVSTYGSDFSTYVGIYTGSSVGSLTSVASGGSAGGTPQSHVLFSAVAGTEYQIQVDSYSSLPGNIALTVSTGSSIFVTPGTLTLYAAQGTNPSSTQTLTLRNAGSGFLSWTASDDAPWLFVGSSSGLLPPGASQPISVVANPTGLASGTYTGTLTITDPASTNGSQSVSVTLHVVSLAWNVPPSGTYDDEEVISMSWTLSAGTAGGTWVSVKYGTSNPPTLLGAPFTIFAGPSGLYSDSVYFHSNSSPTVFYAQPHAIVGDLTVVGPIVSFTVNPFPSLEVDPDIIDFGSIPLGGTAPDQNVIVNNTGGGTLYWMAELTSAPWLTLSASSGAVGAGASQPINLSADVTGLFPGTYPAVLTFHALSGYPWSEQVAISLTVYSDTSPPTVSINQAAGQADPTPNQPILFTVGFSEPVTGFTAGDVVVSGTAGATTVSVSGAGSTYTVSVSGALTGGTVQVSIPAGVAIDAAGNPNSASTSGDNLVTYDPSLPAVATLSTTAPDGLYSTGAAIPVTVTFSTPVTLAGGNLLVALDSGGTVTIPPFASASSVTGTYTVAVGHNSPDLTAVPPLVLSGGATLMDGLGNPTDLSIPAGQNLGDGRSVVIDTAPPAVVAVTSATPDGIYGPGSVIAITLQFSEPVTLTGGNLWVTLDSGATVPITPFASSTFATTNYSIAPGQNSTDLMVTLLTLDVAAELRDTVNLNASLSLPPGQNLADTRSIQVDTTPPIVQITSPLSGSTVESLLATLQGTATDDRGVNAVTWASSPSGASDLASYTNPGWSATVLLQSGVNSVTVTATDMAGNQAPATITLTSIPPLLIIGSASLSFTAPFGGPSPAPQTLQLSNGGAGILGWSATPTPGWLALSPASGALPGGAFQSISVFVDSSSLSIGTHSGNVHIAAPGATAAPQTISITVEVTSLPALALSPLDLVFDIPLGGPNPPPKPLTLSNLGGGVLAWTATPAALWLSSNRSGGTLVPGASETLSVWVDAAGMAAGTSTTSLTIDGGAAGSAVVAVTIHVNGGPIIGLDPEDLTVNAPVGGPNPAARTVLLANQGTGSLSWAASSTVSWLGVSPTAGVLNTAAVESLTLTVNTTGLAAGTYGGTVSIVAPAASNSPDSIVVTLIVNAGPKLELDSDSLQFQASQGSTSLHSKTVGVMNVGTGILPWSVADNAAWLSTNLGGGTVGAGLSQPLLISVDPSGRAAGIYRGSVTVSAASSNSPQVISVTLQVNAAPFIEADPKSFFFTSVGAGQALTVTNGGAGTMVWTATSAAPWVSVAPPGGSLAPGVSGISTVLVDPAGLAPGTYTAQVSISDAGATNSPQSVFISLRVDPPAAPQGGGGQSDRCGLLGIEHLLLLGLACLRRRACRRS